MVIILGRKDKGEKGIRNKELTTDGYGVLRLSQYVESVQ